MTMTMTMTMTRPEDRDDEEADDEPVMIFSNPPVWFHRFSDYVPEEERGQDYSCDAYSHFHMPPPPVEDGQDYVSFGAVITAGQIVEPLQDADIRPPDTMPALRSHLHLLFDSLIGRCLQACDDLVKYPARFQESVPLDQKANVNAVKDLMALHDGIMAALNPLRVPQAQAEITQVMLQEAQRRRALVEELREQRLSGERRMDWGISPSVPASVTPMGSADTEAASKSVE
ncbi:mediator complex, subunit Med7 [Kipferlia bialata]|uniref:Mediator of RNA polymerase II transcription subunit 7 n=1 Tax=Kipferlia bialata TaxID=797122 RepID=A0A9K3CPH4_9EUKA|nr:mediator complex, subunit Med7 [Kipferlia bialata]|eukprot:g635.t1